MTTLNFPSRPRVAGDPRQVRLIDATEIRMSELVAALSMALDFTTGQPEGHCSRTCLIGMKLADKLSLAPDDCSALYYALLLKDLGCSSNSARMTQLFRADDHLIKRQGKLIDWTSPKETLKYVWKCSAPGGSLIEKLMCLAAIAKLGADGSRQIVETRCERGADIIRSLQLPESAAMAVRSLDEHWNGRGQPSGLKGEEIPLLSRVLCLAQTVEIFFTTFGLEAALDVAEQRSGEWFDPALVEALRSLRGEPQFWQSLARGNLVREISRLEPEDRLLVADEAAIDRVAEAFASVVDAKSPWTFQHSTRVAEIAVGVAQELGCSPDLQRDLRRAGLLHDIGKLGVSNQILDKPGKPTDNELAEIRKHPDYSEQILRNIAAFDQLSDVASAHHERMDGNGYHRRLTAEALPWSAMIITVADICEAMSARRPYRDAIPWWRIQEIMASDVDRGVSAECFEALSRFQDRQQLESRVEAQLNEVDRLLRLY